MKVILLKELKGRGGEGDVIDVAQGFAVNYLLPQGIALKATKGELKQLEQRRGNTQASSKTHSTARRSRSRQRSARKASCSARSPRPSSQRPSPSRSA